MLLDWRTLKFMPLWVIIKMALGELKKQMHNLTFNCTWLALCSMIGRCDLLLVLSYNLWSHFSHLMGDGCFIVSKPSWMWEILLEVKCLVWMELFQGQSKLALTNVPWRMNGMWARNPNYFPAYRSTKWMIKSKLDINSFEVHPKLSHNSCI